MLSPWCAGFFADYQQLYHFTGVNSPLLDALPGDNPASFVPAGRVDRWRTALVAGLFLIALSLVPVYYRSAQVEDWNSTVHWLEQRAQQGDGLVCFDNDVQQGCQIAVEYYLDAYPNGTHFPGDSPGTFSWENFGHVDPATGSNAAVDPQALARYAANHPHLFYIIGRVPTDAAAKQAQAAQQWLDGHYRLLWRIHTPTFTISWYATS